MVKKYLKYAIKNYEEPKVLNIFALFTSRIFSINFSRLANSSLIGTFGTRLFIFMMIYVCININKQRVTVVRSSFRYNGHKKPAEWRDCHFWKDSKVR